MSSEAKAMFEAFQQLTPAQKRDFERLWREDHWREFDESTSEMRKLAEEKGWTEEYVAELVMKHRYGDLKLHS